MSKPPASEAAALAALQRGDLADAERLARAVLGGSRKSVQARQVLGVVANQRGWFDEAVKHFEALVKLRPKDAPAHGQLAFALMYQGTFDKARTAFNAALRLDPRDPRALRGLAELDERNGDVDRALERLAPLLAQPPIAPETAFLHATLLEKAKRAEDALAAALPFAEATNIAPITRRKILFTIGKAYDRLERYDDAFAAYASANAVGGRPFDPERASARLDAILDWFTPERVAALPRTDATSAVPVFIVGMPRSGSTLVEQIIDAHPEAHGAGETTAFLELLDGLPARLGATAPYPAWLADLPAGAGDRLARPYLASVTRRAKRARRVADKNLLNYRHIGALATLLPRARVIHCRRDPIANGVSCYVNDLSPIGFPWAGTLDHIGTYWGFVERAMSHWKHVLDLPILTVDYESLVADAEAGSRAIIDFCGLDWDDRCLRFYASGRAVTTLSYDQVRRPIYRSALTRHERYAGHLDPLRASVDRARATLASDAPNA